MDTASHRRGFFDVFEIPVNFVLHRGTVEVFNHQNFSFNYKSNFKSRINRMAFSYVVLNKENDSISNIILIFLINNLNTLIFLIFFNISWLVYFNTEIQALQYWKTPFLIRFYFNKHLSSFILMCTV